jgi:hypothetical protein
MANNGNVDRRLRCNFHDLSTIECPDIRRKLKNGGFFTLNHFFTFYQGILVCLGSLNPWGFSKNRRSKRYGKNSPVKSIDENNRKPTINNATIIRDVGYPDAVL